MESYVKGPSVKELTASELEKSHSYGGRSIFGWEPLPARVSKVLPNSTNTTATHDIVGAA